MTDQQQPTTGHQGGSFLRAGATWTYPAILAFVVDIALTLGLGYAAIRAPLPDSVTDRLKYPIVAGLIAALVVSIVNRIVLQWVVRASVGKLLFGLRVVRSSDGGRAGLGYLLRSWLFSFGYLLTEAANLETEKTGRFSAATVSRSMR